MNICSIVFDNYLLKLGYLKHDNESIGNSRKLIITEKGKKHSATTNSFFNKRILWDYEVYNEVVKMKESRECDIKQSIDS